MQHARPPLAKQERNCHMCEKQEDLKGKNKQPVRAKEKAAREKMTFASKLHHLLLQRATRTAGACFNPLSCAKSRDTVMCCSDFLSKRETCGKNSSRQNEMLRQPHTETVLLLFLGTLFFFINKNSFCHEKLMCSPLKQKQNFTSNCHAINFLVLFAESSLKLWVICFEPHTENSSWEIFQLKKMTPH